MKKKILARKENLFKRKSSLVVYGWRFRICQKRNPNLGMKGNAKGV